MSDAITIMEPKVVPLRSGGRVAAIIPQNVEEVFRLATAIAKSGLAPSTMRTPEALTVAILHGAEIGLPPMMAVQKIAVNPITGWLLPGAASKPHRPVKITNDITRGLVSA